MWSKFQLLQKVDKTLLIILYIFKEAIDTIETKHPILRILIAYPLVDTDTISRCQTLVQVHLLFVNWTVNRFNNCEGKGICTTSLRRME